jgi:hypothetical protein
LRTRRYLAAFTFAFAAVAGVLPLPASCADAAAVTRYDAARDAAGDIDRAPVAARATGPKLDWVPTPIEFDTAGRVVRLSPSTEFHEGDKLAPARIRAFLAGP